MTAAITYIDWYRWFESQKLGLLAHAHNYRFHNFSAVQLPNSDDFLYAVKCLFVDKELPGYLRPGNSPGTAYSEDTGCDFWWNRWQESRGGVVFFVGNHTSNLKVLPVNPASDSRSFRGVLLQGDARLYVDGTGGIFQHDPDLRVYQVHLENGQVRLSYKSHVNCGIDDKNMSLLSLEPFIYVDWFRDKGLVIKRGTVTEAESEVVIPYAKGRGLRGTGSCIGDTYSPTPYPDLSYEQFTQLEMDHFGVNYGLTPHLCFGTPAITVTHPSLGSGYLGVGHSKIWNNPSTMYRYGSGISDFRHYFHLVMRRHFGNRYIKHFGRESNDSRPSGFLYLFNFFFIRKDLSRCYISDSFMPFALKHIHGPSDRDYQFGVAYPTSLIVLPTGIAAITMGIGDWYSAWCEIPLASIFASLKHDSRNLDMSNYGYHIVCPTVTDLPLELRRFVVDHNLSRVQ